LFKSYNAANNSSNVTTTSTTSSSNSLNDTTGYSTSTIDSAMVNSFISSDSHCI
jgi:hypothetical protein